MPIDPTRREFIERCAAAALLAGLPTRAPAQTEAIPEELLAATRVVGPEQPVIGRMNGIPFTGSPSYIPGLDQQITAIMKETGIPGFSFAVSRYVDRRSGKAPWGANELKFVRGYGYANVEDQVPLTGLVPMRAGSVSKVITALAACRANDQAVLGLDEPVFPKARWTRPEVRPNERFSAEAQRWVSQPFDERWNKVTAAHLLSHSSCTPEFPPDRTPLSAEEWAELRSAANLVHRMPDLPRAVRYNLRVPLDGEPGTQAAYRGRGIDMLAVCLGDLAGNKFDDLVRQYLMQPLGISGAFLESMWPELYDLTPFRGYEWRNGAHSRIGSSVWGWYFRSLGSGAWMLPMVGLCRLGSFYRYLLKPATFQRMFERPEWLVKLGREAAGDKWNAYHGLGWIVVHWPDGRIMDITHNGMVGGARARFGYSGNPYDCFWSWAANSDYDDGINRCWGPVWEHIRTCTERNTWPAGDLWPEYGFSEPDLAFPQEVRG